MANLRNSLVLSFTERYITLSINVIATMLIARMLTPVEIGVYSVGAGIINIAQTLRDFGIANYVLQEEKLTRCRLATALGLSVGMSFLISGIFILLSQPIAIFFDEPRLRSVILVMTLSFLGVAFSSIGLARLQRAMNFSAVLRIGVGQTIVHAVSSVMLASKGFGALGMAWASVLSIWASVIGMYCYFPRDTFLLPSLKEWRRIVNFGAFSGGGSLLQEIGNRTPDIIIGRMLGFGSAGLYSRGNGLISLYQQALMGAITPVLLGSLAMLSRNGASLRAPFLQFFGSITALAWPFLGMIAVLALPIIHIFFGDQWLAAAPVARILCVSAGLMVIGQMCLAVFTATGTVRRFFIVQSVSAGVQVLLLILGALHSIEAAATGILISNIVLAVLSLHHLHGVIGSTWYQIFRELLQSAFLTACTLSIPTAVMLLFGITTERFWAPTLSAALGGGITWLAMIFLLNHPLRTEIGRALDVLRTSRPQPLPIAPTRSKAPPTVL